MKTFLTTAAIVAALTLPAFAEGETTGTEAQGEADGSFKASAQEPAEVGQGGVPQDSFLLFPGVETTGAASASSRTRNFRPAPSEEGGINPAGSGMDGGNRR